MNLFSRHLFYITTLFLVVCTHASLPLLPSLPSANLTAFNTSAVNTSSVGFELKCFDIQVFKRRRTRVIDCARSLTRLPYYHLPGVFHNDEPADIFTLPYIARYDRCQVTVSIDAYPGRSESSWLAIHAAASDIVFGCPYDYSPTSETGGELTVGTPGNIQIIVERVRT